MPPHCLTPWFSPRWRALLYLGTLAVALMLPSFASAEATETRTGPPARALVEEWLAHHQDRPAMVVDFVQERQLKTLRRPLSRSGRLWSTPDGRFRWQIDDPATLLLLREKPDAPLLWIDYSQGTYRLLDEETEPSEGHTAALRFLLASTAPDWEAFERIFELHEATAVANAPGHWRLRLDVRSKRAQWVVKEVSLQVEPATGALHSLEFQLRDGSSLCTRVTQVQPDSALPAALFSVAVQGLKRETR